jgi:hypothetical protein
MTRARDLASTALNSTVNTTELGYLDGVTSSVQTQLDAKIAKSLTTTTGDIIYASAANTPARLGIGSTDQVLKVTAGVPAWATPAATGVTWTFKANTTMPNPTAVAYSGSIYVLVGPTGRLFTSTDLITWTSRTSGFGSSNINDVEYYNGLFVAVGNSGILTTSTDGITWTARTAGVSTNALHDVTYQNSLWVAVGAGASGSTGGVTTSTDGITWTKRTTPASSATTLYNVNYANGYWLAVGNDSTVSGIYSTDATTWTALAATGTLSGGASLCTYADGKWIMFTQATDSPKFATTNPTGAWYVIDSAIHPQVLNSSAKSTTFTYNGKMYFLAKNTTDTIMPFNLSIVTLYGGQYSFISWDTPIQNPILNYDAGATPASQIRFIYSNGSGGFALFGAYGQVWASF